MSSVHSSLSNNRRQVNHNLFYVWRCVVSMAHADGVLKPVEVDYLKKIFLELNLTDGQRQTLAADLEAPQDFNVLFSHVNEQAYRAMVYDFCRLMAYKDGVVSVEEDQLLKRLHAELLPPGRLDEIKTEVREVLKRKLVIHDTEMDKHRPIFDPKRPTSVLLWLVDEFFLMIGIDLMRD